MYTDIATPRSDAAENVIQGDTHLVRSVSYRNLTVLQSIDLTTVVNMLKSKKIEQLS